VNVLVFALTTVASSSVAATIVGSVFAYRIKDVERRNSESLESIRNSLVQQRDSRQARIGLGRFATERALELEFKAVADVYAALARLRDAHDSCRPMFGFAPVGETAEEREERYNKGASALWEAFANAQRLVDTVKLFIPEALCKVIQASMEPAHNKLVDISVYTEDRFTTGGMVRALKIRENGKEVRIQAEKALRDRLEELKRLPD
jgi:hypothetical protein